MENILIIFAKISFVADVVGSAILVWAFCLALVKLVSALYKHGFMSTAFTHSMRHVRLSLGNYLLLALEMMIVSDIIHTVLEPTTEEIVRIFVIVIIRTIIAYSLTHEMSDLRKE